MSAVAKRKEYTIEDLLALPDNGKSYELVDGRLVELNVSNLSSLVAQEVGRRLGNHSEPNDLGRVFNAEAIYRMFPRRPRTGRKPDVSFIHKEHLPADWVNQGYFTIPPDLAVEVVSPNDLSYEVEAKIAEYLKAGVRLVWVINPQQRVAYVHRVDGTVTKLHEGDTLSGEDVVSGFQCRVGELFPAATALPT